GVSISKLGVKILKFIDKNPLPPVFKRSQKNYEEIIILELGTTKGSTIKELVNLVPYNSLIVLLHRLKPYLNIKHIHSHRKILKEYNEKTLSENELKIAKIIAANKNISTNQIISAINIHPRTVYKILKKLENKGIITREKPHKIYSLNNKGEKILSYLTELIKVLKEELTDEINIALVILDCLAQRKYPVTDREIFEECFNKPAVDNMDIEEFNKIKNDLKVFGFIVGNVYMGYTLSKETVHHILQR
ncbi:MAG: MarR family transcriptional regulator, partial [Candidatus Odinarchaeia archaeon]